MGSPNPIISGSGSMLDIVEDVAEIWPLLWGKHKWALSLLGQVQLTFPSCFSGVTECCAAMAQRTFTSDSDLAYLIYSPSELRMG